MRKYYYLRVILSAAVVLSMLMNIAPETVSAAGLVTIIAADSSKNTPNYLGYLYTGSRFFFLLFFTIVCNANMASKTHCIYN